MRANVFTRDRCQYCDAGAAEDASNFQKLRAVGQVSIAFGRDQNDVFQTHTAVAKIIQPGLHGDHVAGAQRGVYRCNARRFMDIQAEAVSRAVEKTLHSAVNFAGVKSARLEQVENILMNLLAVNSIAYLVEADLLPSLYRRIDLLESFRSASTHHSPAQIAEVTVLLRARKDIENNRRVGFDRTAALMVRVDTLVAGGDNGVARQPALSHDRRIDRRLEHLRSQPSAV